MGWNHQPDFFVDSDILMIYFIKRKMGTFFLTKKIIFRLLSFVDPLSRIRSRHGMRSTDSESRGLFGPCKRHPFIWNEERLLAAPRKVVFFLHFSPWRLKGCLLKSRFKEMRDRDHSINIHVLFARSKAGLQLGIFGVNCGSPSWNSFNQHELWCPPYRSGWWLFTTYTKTNVSPMKIFRSRAP